MLRERERDFILIYYGMQPVILKHYHFKSINYHYYYYYYYSTHVCMGMDACIFQTALLLHGGILLPRCDQGSYLNQRRL